MTKKLRISVKGEKITINHFLSYGNDSKYFAVNGKKLYVRRDKEYELLMDDN